MTDDETMKSGIGRRAALRQAALLVATSCVLGLAVGESAVADEKLSQKDAEYQPTPKNGQNCANCQHFEPPSACKLVKGKVSPQGWCDFWGSKS